MSTLASVIQRGLRSAQPTAASVGVGVLYYVTDENLLERSSGSAWQSYSGTTAAVSGALILLEERIASASAALSLTTRNVGAYTGATFQSDFDEYMIEIVGLIPASNDANCRMRMSTNGGSSYDAGNNYSQAYNWNTTNATVNAGGASGANYMDMGGNINNSTTGGLNASYRVYDPLSTTKHKVVQGLSNFLHTSIGFMNWMRLLVYNVVTPVNAIQIDMIAASGGAAMNISSGKIRVYGISKP